MRIEAYTQVQKLYSAKSASKASKTGRSAHADAVEISNTGKDFQAVKKAVDESADIREELVAPIKARINSGTYQVSGESFAEKLIQKYNEKKLQL